MKHNAFFEQGLIKYLKEILHFEEKWSKHYSWRLDLLSEMVSSQEHLSEPVQLMILEIDTNNYPYTALFASVKNPTLKHNSLAQK